MKHRKMLVGLICICVLFVSASTIPAQVKPKPIKIGFMYDLTGIYSAMGVDTQNTVKVGVELLNKEGGIKGHPIEYVTYDGESNATKAALTAKKLIELEKVHVVQGCNGTGVALAVGPVCEQNKVPFITATASEVFENTLKPYWSFRVTWRGWEMVDLGLGMIKRLDPNAKKIAILYQGAAFGKQLYENAEYFAPERGFKIVAAEKYDPTGTEFGAQISKIMAAQPDAVAVYCADMAGPLAMKQMREMGMNKIIVSNGAINLKAIRAAFNSTFSIPPYVYMAGNKADVWWQLPKESVEYKIIEPIAMVYERTFKDRYGAVQHLPMGGLLILKDAIGRALSEDPNLFDRDLQAIRTVIRDKVETTKNLNVAGGIFTMTPKDHCGVIPGTPFAPCHWENGNLIYDSKLSDIRPLPAPPTLK